MKIVKNLEQALEQAKNSNIPNKGDVVACLEMTLADVKLWLENKAAE